ncbi:MAG: Gmad2 immunoglobulin-like domain-containing protein [Candidatus Pacebacteria bacterium]|nr:Gmad2 immunoglobulin-like domain-containing protein [Candidatus Paceibacterota bacterium]
MTNKQNQTISLSNLPSIIIAVVFIVGVGAVYGLIGYLFSGIKENVTPIIQKPSLEITDNYFGNEFIQVKSPQKNATIKNPVLISGKANVYEANVRIRISDDNKNILADDFITAGGWMDKLYSFEKEIGYETPQTENGLIEIFEESVKDGSEIYKVEVPVVFGDYEDAFSDWKVYRNEEYGVEFKYPKEWGDYNEIKEEERLLRKTRGKTYNFDNSDFKLSFERKGFEVENRFYVFTLDLLPARFGEIIDVDNYCSSIEKENNFVGLNLSCKVVELDDQKGILRDDITCIGGSTGGEMGCNFHRILLVKTKSLEYPLFIVNTSIEYYNYYESCDYFSEKGSCFDGAEKKYEEALEKHKNKIDTFDQILSSFKFIEEDETVDWQTYRNEEFGYEMKYSKNVVEIFSDSVFERGSKGNPSFKIKSGGHFALGVWENPERLSFKEWLEKRDAMGTTYSVQEVMIGNHKGYSALNLIYSCHIEWRGIEKENKFYTFGVEICEDDRDISLETFNQILSTFKFIEK